eukprot:COSAG05_NODE_1151_length_5713_cov_19.933915_7_plen_159_part_00
MCVVRARVVRARVCVAGGREEGRVEVTGVWTKDSITLDVQCARLFGEQTDYVRTLPQTMYHACLLNNMTVCKTQVLLLERVSGEGRFFSKNPIDPPTAAGGDGGSARSSRLKNVERQAISDAERAAMFKVTLLSLLPSAVHCIVYVRGFADLRAPEWH